MQIPEALQHFAEPALIVTADHFQARLWIAFEDSMEEIETLELPKTELSDNEGKEIGQEMTDEERTRRFISGLADHINQLIRDEEAASSLHLIAPADVINPLKKLLAPEAANIINKELDVNVMKEDAVQILERIVAA